MNKRPIPTSDDVLRRMLSTPPDPKVAKPKAQPEKIWPKPKRAAK